MEASMFWKVTISLAGLSPSSIQLPISSSSQAVVYTTSCAAPNTRKALQLSNRADQAVEWDKLG